MKLNTQHVLALYLINIRIGFGAEVTVDLLSQDEYGDILADISQGGFEPRRIKLHAKGGFQGELKPETTMGNDVSSEEEDEDMAFAGRTRSTMEKGSSNG